MNRSGWIVRKVWDLQRFGLTPWKLWARLTNQSEPSILLISIPKAGTHLLERALCLHPRLYRKCVPTLHQENLDRYGGLESLLDSLKPGQILVSHLYYSPERLRLAKESGVLCVFVIRDPHDVALSSAYYVAHNGKHPYHSLFEGLGLKERILLAIAGDPETGFIGMNEMMKRFAGWMDTSNLVIRFEQLIDPKSRERVLSSLYDSMSIKLSSDLLSFIGGNLVSSASPTFRKGTTGEWRRIFDEEINALFEHTMDEDLMEWYGYGNG
jgi:hypothetical protein